jgi:hypothetical protein
MSMRASRSAPGRLAALAVAPESATGDAIGRDRGRESTASPAAAHTSHVRDAEISSRGSVDREVNVKLV